MIKHFTKYLKADRILTMWVEQIKRFFLSANFFIIFSVCDKTGLPYHNIILKSQDCHITQTVNRSKMITLTTLESTGLFMASSSSWSRFRGSPSRSARVLLQYTQLNSGQRFGSVLFRAPGSGQQIISQNCGKFTQMSKKINH